MDAKSRRIFIKQMNMILRLFSIEFVYQIPNSSSNSKVPDFIPKKDNDQEFVKVHEPLLPIGTATQSIGNQAQMLPGGMVENYSHEWVSRLDLPIKTKVKYKNKNLYINKRADYQDVAGIFIYYLSGRSDLNGLSSENI